MGLNTTVGLFVAQLILIGICYWQDRKKVNPLKPRLIPYRLIMLVLIVTSLTTLAHLIALITGNPVEPRRRTGM